MKRYRNRLQKWLVIDGVKALLELTRQHGVGELSEETLRLILEQYCNLVDPAVTPGPATDDEEIGTDD